jgi:hypothetical protein
MVQEIYPAVFERLSCAVTSAPARRTIGRSG